MPVSFCLAGFNAVSRSDECVCIIQSGNKCWNTHNKVILSSTKPSLYGFFSFYTKDFFLYSSHCWPSWQLHVSDCNHALHRLPDSHSSSMDSLSASGSAIPQHFRDSLRLKAVEMKSCFFFYTMKLVEDILNKYLSSFQTYVFMYT